MTFLLIGLVGGAVLVALFALATCGLRRYARVVRLIDSQDGKLD